MVDMCWEKKTGIAEECGQSDGKRALPACTECGILLGASGVQKRCDMITLQFCQDEPCGVVLDLLYAHDMFIGYSCESSTAVIPLLIWRNELFCGTVREERTDRGDSPECEKRSAAEATDVLFHWQCGQDALQGT